MKNLFYALVLAFVTFAGFSLPATTMAQNIDVLRSDTTSVKETVVETVDYGLSDVKLKESLWYPVFSRNEIGMMYSAKISNNGFRLGLDMKDLLKAIRDAEILESPEVAKWMESSLLTEKGRIKSTYLLHEISVGGPSVRTTTGETSFMLGRNRVTIESGTAYKTLTVKLTHKPSGESKTFYWLGEHSSDNLMSFSLPLIFEALGLPGFRMDANRQSDPAIRKGLVAVKRLWATFEKEGIPEMRKWVIDVHTEYLKRREVAGMILLHS